MRCRWWTWIVTPRAHWLTSLMSRYEQPPLTLDTADIWERLRSVIFRG
jgi:hypothetical protein